MIVSSLVVCAAALFVSAVPRPAAALTFTCETVTRKFSLDPAMAEFRGDRFRSPAINSQGDVVFHARAKKAPRRLYLYPASGAPSIVAAEGDVAPGGSAFHEFANPSINDDGDLGFHARTFLGEGVFVRESGGSLVKAAVTADVSPGGGVFVDFPAVSRVDAAGNIAFEATVSGGPNGIFLYDVALNTVTAVALVGDPTGDGRLFCSFGQFSGTGATFGLSDVGHAVFGASTETLCLGAPETIGIWQDNGVTFTPVAEVGGTTPVAGTTYSQFLPAPDANATDQVVFRARYTGVVGGTGIFGYDPVGPTSSLFAATGSGAPVVGGSFSLVAPGGISDSGRAGIGGTMKHGVAKSGIFLFDGTDEPVVADSDLVPTDLFGTGSTYVKINPGSHKSNDEIGMSRSGTWFVYSAKARDTVGPPTKLGLFRCEGL